MRFALACATYSDHNTRVACPCFMAIHFFGDYEIGLACELKAQVEISASCHKMCE